MPPQRRTVMLMSRYAPSATMERYQSSKAWRSRTTLGLLTSPMLSSYAPNYAICRRSRIAESYPRAVPRKVFIGGVNKARRSGVTPYSLLEWTAPVEIATVTLIPNFEYIESGNRWVEGPHSHLSPRPQLPDSLAQPLRPDAEV